MLLPHVVRFALIAVAMSAGASATLARNAGDDAVNKFGYDGAMKCFVANGLATGDARDVDPKKAAYFEGKARESFNVASNLGEKLGYTKAHVSQDFSLVQARELPHMIADTAYFKQAASYCKALGLM